MKTGKGRNATGDADIQWGDKDWLDEGDDPNGDDADDDAGEFNPDRSPVDVLWAYSRAPHAVWGLPVRYLAHDKLSHIYQAYTAAMHAWLEQAEQTPGVSTETLNELRKGPSNYDWFRTRYRDKWRKCLKFRKSSQHAMCQTCFDHQQVLDSKKASREDKELAARRLREHWNHQYTDRQIYWHFRWASAQPGSNVLCIIIDAWDKAKTAWPRWPYSRLPHGSLHGSPRPRSVLTAAIAHGYCTKLFLNDDTLPHGVIPPPCLEKNGILDRTPQCIYLKTWEANGSLAVWCSTA